MLPFSSLPENKSSFSHLGSSTKRGLPSSRSLLCRSEQEGSESSINFLRDDRERSESLTSFYRDKNERRDYLANKAHQLNVFIHLGIDKFLDRQAVRDLITEYDSEDIYIGGAKNFFTDKIKLEKNNNTNFQWKNTLNDKLKGSNAR